VHIIAGVHAVIPNSYIDQFRPSICVCLEHPEQCTAKKLRDTRYTYSYYGIEPIGSSIRARLLRPHLRPHIRQPLPQTGGWQPPVKTCIANCGQTVPDTRVVCIDSLWELINSLPNRTNVEHLGALSLSLYLSGACQVDVAVSTSSRHADLSNACHLAVARPKLRGRRSSSTVLSQDCLGLPTLRCQSLGGPRMHD